LLFCIHQELSFISAPPSTRALNLQITDPLIPHKIKEMKAISLKNMKWWQIALVAFAVVFIGTLSQIRAGGDPGEQFETE